MRLFDLDRSSPLPYPSELRNARADPGTLRA
jgi:hypothetical protein